MKGHKRYLILAHQTGEGTLIVVDSWKVKCVSQTTGIAESIDLHSYKVISNKAHTILNEKFKYVALTGAGRFLVCS